MYEIEELGPDDDDGTMPDNVSTLADAVVGHKIVSADVGTISDDYWPTEGLIITLDNGTQVRLADTNDCCAYTELRHFLLHPDKIDHVILGVGTTEGFTRWHIYADWGDVLELTVGWSCGNPFYYGYGFSIDVVPV